MEPSVPSKGHLGRRKRKSKGWEQGGPTASLVEPEPIIPPDLAQS